MQLFGWTISFRRTKAASLPLAPLSSGGGWWSLVRDPVPGAWQSNAEIRADDVLTYSAVFACVTLIASDIAKLNLRLVERDHFGIWTETSSAAFSPVLRKPNRYQTRIKFVEQWLVSKLIHGNTYVLKERDQRGVVKALYVLDPTRVTPLVAPDGSIYYQLRRDNLTGLQADSITVPASEIIHDAMVALYHPLIGVSPIYACGQAALQGLSIQNNSKAFFTNGSNPGGVLTAPGAISNETAARLAATWKANYSGPNAGNVAVLGDGLKYEKMATNAVDAQLIEQLNWTAVNVCNCYHVQPYMIGIGPPPPYANVEPLLQRSYAQPIQPLLESFELCLDEGLELPPTYGTEFDIDDLLRMDTLSKTKAAADAIGSGGMSPNEARYRYLNLGPVPGGDTPYLQQRYYALSALARRDQEPIPPPAPEQLASAALSQRLLQAAEDGSLYEHAA